MGIEDFKLTSIRSMAVTLCTFGAIVLFVNDESDILIYVFIQSFGMLLSQLIMWLFVFKKIKFIKPTLSSLFPNLRESLTFFIPQISIMFYTNLNKTLLGIFDTKTSVAFFSNAFLIVMVIRTIISTVDTVLLPKLSNLSSKSDNKTILKILNSSLNIQLGLTIPAMFGVILIAPKFVPWFFGNEFYPVIKLMQLLSVLIVIVPAGMSISRQWLIPQGNLKAYNISVFFGGLIGIISNLILIPLFGATGAVLSTIISELFVSIIRIVSFLKETKFKYNLELITKSFISSFFMYIIASKLFGNFSASILTTLIQVVTGISLFFIATMFLNWKNKDKIIKFVKKK